MTSCWICSVPSKMSKVFRRCPALQVLIRHTLKVAVGELTVRVLGPVQLIGVDGQLVDLPSASQRRLLAALALHASTPVRAEWLCSVLDVTPGALRTSVSRLRRAVGKGRLQTTIGGYRLDAPVDAALACAEIRAGTDDPVALARALERWIGPASRSSPTSRGRWAKPLGWR